MADPVTWLMVGGLVLSAAGTGVAVHSAIEQGKAQEDAAKFNAEVARQNAIAAGQQAAFDAEQIRRKNLILAGRQRAAAAKSGVLLSGSVQDVISDSAVQGELEALARLYGGTVASNRFGSESKLFKSEGRTARSLATQQAAGTLLSGLGSVSSKTAQFPTFNTTKNTSPVLID